jgi:uncharacterized protein
MVKSNKRSRTRLFFKWVLWVLLFQFVLINISAALHAWKQTHFYTDPELRVYKPSSKNIFAKTWKLFAGFKYPRSVLSKRPDFSYDSFRLKTQDGKNIDCWFSHKDSAKGTVILVHQLTTNRSFILTEASEFLFMGYNVLLFDLPGHGNSYGNTTTLGYSDTRELKLMWDFIKEKGEKNIYLWGSSLGAVIITKTINDYNIKPAGIILEVPFASLQNHLEGRSRGLGFPAEPFGFLVTLWVGIEQGYNGFKFRPAEYSKKINCPVLLQWGSDDIYVLEKQERKIFENIPGLKKRFVIYENAGHQSFLGFDPVKWKEEVGSFLTNPASTHP